MTQVINDNQHDTGEKPLTPEAVNDKAVKRLLRQDNLKGLQIGRILFLNVCEMTEGREQLYSSEEFIGLLNKLSSKEVEIDSYVFYQRLSTYAVNEINELMVRDSLSLKGFKYIYSQFNLYKVTKKDEVLDTEEIQKTIFDIRLNLKYINSYALFFDAVRKMLKDRRLKSKYRIIRQSKPVIEESKKYDEYLLKTFSENERKRLNLYCIGEIPRVYTEHEPRKETIDAIISFLKNVFDPKTSSMDNMTTSSVAMYINSHFPRD